MSRNEIRLRRQRLASRGSERFRNYDDVLKGHEENQRIKKIIKVFVFFAVILILLMIIIMVNQWEKKATQKNVKENPEMTQPEP